MYIYIYLFNFNINWESEKMNWCGVNTTTFTYFSLMPKSTILWRTGEELTLRLSYGIAILLKYVQDIVLQNEN